jgi:hypothetical protein
MLLLPPNVPRLGDMGRPRHGLESCPFKRGLLWFWVTALDKPRTAVRNFTHGAPGFHCRAAGGHASEAGRLTALDRSQNGEGDTHLRLSGHIRLPRHIYQLQPAEATLTNDAATSIDAMMAATIFLIRFSFGAYRWA